MLNLIIFGPPGAGKGTQAAKLVEKYKLKHISTGAILRAEIKSGTELGKTAKKIIDTGKLVSDEIVNALVEKVIEKDISGAGFIFDGYPRTRVQVEALDKILEKHNAQISLVILLNVDNKEVTERMLHRAKTEGRSDDNGETIQNRIETYYAETAPIAEYYLARKKLKMIYGIGGIEIIFQRICEAVEVNTK